MTNLYILMGTTQTRKSATIRALTGYTRRNPLQVRLVENGDTKTIYVIPSSPQENLEPFDRGIERIAQEGHEWDVLLAMHPDRALDFIQRIPPGNRDEIYIAPLGMVEIPENLQRQFEEAQLNPIILHPGIENSSDMPANEIAHIIREHWNWL